jgi:hypothetical protein
MISAPVCLSGCWKHESGPAPGGSSHEKDGPRDSVQNPLPRIGSPFCAGLGAICGARWCVELGSLRASKHSCKRPMPGSKDRHAGLTNREHHNQDAPLAVTKLPAALFPFRAGKKHMEYFPGRRVCEVMGFYHNSNLEKNQ